MEQLREAIAERIQASGISIRSIAKTCDIPEANIRNFLKGRVKNPRIDTLEKICHACGTSIESILASQNRDSLDTQFRAQSDALRVTSDEKSPSPASNDAHPASVSQNVYKSSYKDPHIFADEGGDEALLMCHALVNTGKEYSGIYQREKTKVK